MLLFTILIIIDFHFLSSRKKSYMNSGFKVILGERKKFLIIRSAVWIPQIIRFVFQFYYCNHIGFHGIQYVIEVLCTKAPCVTEYVVQQVQIHFNMMIICTKMYLIICVCFGSKRFMASKWITQRVGQMSFKCEWTGIWMMILWMRTVSFDAENLPLIWRWHNNLRDYLNADAFELER